MKQFMLLFFIITCCISCSKEDPINIEKPVVYSIQGEVEKGPFIKGSKVTIQELNEELVPSGKVFIENIQNDEGSFNFKNIELLSPVLQLTAEGYFFNEVSGKLSDSNISLMALVDFKEKTSVNVNILTHISRERVLNLIDQGNSFADANKQAQKELLTCFGLQKYSNKDVSSYSITAGTEEAGALLVISATLLDKKSEAEFIENITELTSEFKEDGDFSTEQKETILNISRSLDLNLIRENVIKRYQELGKEITVLDLTYFVDWDADGIAGNELGDIGKEKELRLEFDTLNVDNNGGVFDIKINSNMKITLEKPNFGEADDTPSIDVLPTGPIGIELNKSDIDFDEKLSQDETILNLRIAKANTYYVTNSKIIIYSSDGSKRDTLHIVQNGDLNTPQYTIQPEIFNEVLSSILQPTQKALEFQYISEAYYSNLYKPSNNYSWNEFYLHRVNSSNSVISQMHSQCYNAIRKINFIKEKTKQIVDIPIIEQSYEHLRTLIYYQMTVLWGNIQYVDKVLDLEDSQSIPQVKEKQMYELLQAELSKYIDVFPNKPSSNTDLSQYLFVSSDVAKTLLAKVLMQQNKYEEAKYMLNEIMNNGTYSLAQSRTIALNEQSKELIYALQGDPSSNYAKEIENNKHFAVHRYAEVLLLAAESNWKLGMKREAIDLLNRLNSRNNVELATISNFELKLKDTWSKEMKGEFSYFAFLKRNKIAEQELNIQSYQYLFPIPMNEIALNPNLLQNPGY